MSRTRYATRVLHQWLTADRDTLDRCVAPFAHLPSREMLAEFERFLRNRFLSKHTRGMSWNEFAVISMGQSVNFRRLAVRLLVEWVVEYVPSEAAAHDPDWWGLDERADVDDSGRPEG